MCRFSYLLQSTILRKVLLVWLLLSLASAATMLVLFMSVSNDSFSDYEKDNMQRTVSTISTIREEYLNGSMSREGMQILQDKISNVRNCSFYIFRIDNDVFVCTDSVAEYIETSDSYMAEIESYAQQFGDNTKIGCKEIEIDDEAFLIAGYPITHGGKITAVAIGVRAGSNARSHKKILDRVFSVILVGFLPLGAVAIMLIIGRIIIPITDITEVAIDMSNGNLNTRVKHTEKHGEIGLLASSFNQLSESLSQSFIQLEQERAILIQVINASTRGIVVIDAEGNLIHYNPALMELFAEMRMSIKQDVSQNNRLMIVPDEDIWTHFDSVMNTGEVEKVVYPIGKDSVLWITISPIISAESEQVGAVGYFQDMTGIERLERTRREYVANVSHELRRPLTSLQGLLEPMRDGLVQDEAHKQRYYDIMLHEVSRLSRLISDMMQISRLQSDNPCLNIQVFNVSDIVIDVAESYNAEIEGRGLTLNTAIEADIFALVDGDRIEQVLIILLDNAIRFNSEGGSIYIEVKQSETQVIISVRDTGCGISKDDQKQVFERFFKVDKSHGSEGTGLGLSIAKHIVQLLQGEIICVSELGKGTEMKLVFKRITPERTK